MVSTVQKFKININNKGYLLAQIDSDSFSSNRQISKIQTLNAAQYMHFNDRIAFFRNRNFRPYYSVCSLHKLVRQCSRIDSLEFIPNLRLDVVLPLISLSFYRHPTNGFQMPKRIIVYELGFFHALYQMCRNPSFATMKFAEPKNLSRPSSVASYCPTILVQIISVAILTIDRLWSYKSSWLSMLEV